MEHFHVQVTENNYYTNRRKCFHGDNARSNACDWINAQLVEDRQFYTDQEREYDSALISLGEFTEEQFIDNWDFAVEVPNATKAGHWVIMGYSIHDPYEACEEIINREES